MRRFANSKPFCVTKCPDLSPTLSKSIESHFQYAKWQFSKIYDYLVNELCIQLGGGYISCLLIDYWVPIDCLLKATEWIGSVFSRDALYNMRFKLAAAWAQVGDGLNCVERTGEEKLGNGQ